MNAKAEIAIYGMLDLHKTLAVNKTAWKQGPAVRDVLGAWRHFRKSYCLL